MYSVTFDAFIFWHHEQLPLFFIFQQQNVLVNRQISVLVSPIKICLCQLNNLLFTSHKVKETRSFTQVRIQPNTIDGIIIKYFMILPHIHNIYPCLNEIYIRKKWIGFKLYQLFINFAIVHNTRCTFWARPRLKINQTNSTKCIT